MDAIYAFAGAAFDAKRGELTRAGRVSRLRPQTAAVLAYLLERPRAVVGKDELLRDVWPNLVVTENSLVQCVREIRRELGDEQGVIVRTAPRRGYVLEADVAARPADLKPAEEAETLRSVRRLPLIVMPLANAGNDPEQAYFADALTDELTIELGRIPEALVVSRSTAQTFRDRPIDIREVGREIGVRYVVEGNVRRRGEDVAVNLSLSETEGGTQVWTDRFEGGRANLDELQLAMAGRLANALGLQLFQAERERLQRKAAGDLDAQDLAMRAWSLWARNEVQANTEAQRLAREALARDPECVRALVTLAHTLISDIVFRVRTDISQVAAETESVARRAATLEPLNSMVNAPLGTAITYQQRFEEALGVFDAQLSLSASFPFTHTWIGITIIFMGRPDVAIPSFQRAIQLNPRAPALSTVYRNVAVAYLHAGDDEQALAYAERSVRLPNPWARSYETLAAVYGNAGLIEDGQAAVKVLLGRWPGYSIAQHRREMVSSRPEFLAQRARLLEGLRRAGLPES
jgi:TolB-like protein/Tfp pilus assembly protein PilF